MGLFDLFKKKKEEPTKKGTIQPKAPPKPACEHGICCVYKNNLCCSCDDSITCDKKKKYDADHRLEPEFVKFYEAYASFEKKQGFYDKRNAAHKVAKEYIKVYQPNMTYFADEMIIAIEVSNLNRLFEGKEFKFVRKMKDVTLPKNCEEKIKYIWDSYKNDKLDIDSEWLYNSSLYDRSVADCRYTVNALNMFSQPHLYSSYFKNTEVVDINMFFDENGNIKPAGQDGREGDTIYNIIESWAEDNEYTPEEIQERKGY